MESSQRGSRLGNPLASLWRRLPRGLRLALVAYAVTRLPLVTFAGILNHYQSYDLRPGHFLYHGGEAHDHWIVNANQKWDSYWFLNIEREGYQFHGVVEQIDRVVPGQPETNVTPFPLYPMLMRAGRLVVGDPSVAGLVVSQIALLLSLVVLFELARLDLSPRASQLAVWLFAAQPWTYAYSAIYSESLFFLLSVSALWAVRRDHLGLGGVVGMMAALTRLPGVLLVIPMAVEVVHRRGARPRQLGWGTLALLLVPAGTLLYFAYLWDLTGEPLAYFVAQRGWHKELVGIWHHPVIWLTAADLDAQQMSDLATAMFVVVTLILGLRRTRLSYWIYAVVAFGVLMSSSYLLGLPRYCSALFPIYLIWACVGEEHPAAGRSLLVMFAMLAPAIFWMWTTWHYAF